MGSQQLTPVNRKSLISVKECFLACLSNRPLVRKHKETVMGHFQRMLGAAAIMLAAGLPSMANAGGTVEVLHWWTSP